MTDKNRILLLDSLRGLAAMVVVIHHAWVIFPQTVDQVHSFSPILKTIWNEISGFNREAVLFFFILSGFSIALSSKRIEWTSKDGINTYLYKRFKRILPLYWVALAFSLLAGWMGSYLSHPSFDIGNLLGNILLLQTSDSIRESWFIPYGKNGPLWSISYEMFYYLIFIPVMVVQSRFFSNHLNHRRLFIFSLFLSLFAILIQKSFFLPWIYFLNSLVIWYAGVYLFDLYFRQSTDNRLFGGLFFVLVLIECMPIIINDFELAGFSSTLAALKNGFWIIILFYSGLLVSLRFRQIGETGIFRLFNVIMKPVGDGSYTIYLIHYPALLLVKSMGFDSFLILSLSVFLITLSSIFLERKLITYPYEFFKIRYLR